MRYHASLAVLVCAGALALVFNLARAQPLEEELLGLLASHPQVREREKQVESTRQGIRKAFGDYLPQVDLKGEYGPQVIDSPIARETGGGAFSETKEVLGVRITQRLFDGFATPSEVRAARLNLEVAEYTLAGIRQNVLFEGIEAYVEVLRQNRLVELGRGNEDTIKRQLNLEDERVKRGAGIAVDVLQAKARLQLAKEQRVAFEGAFEDALARYARVFGHLPDVARMSLPALPLQQLPQTADQALRIAEDENPAIDSSLATVEFAGERRRHARSDYFPVLNLVAAANHETNNDLVRGTRQDYSVFLEATWTLFNGFATMANVQQAAFDYRAAQDNHERVRREVLQHTRLAWNELQTALARVDLLDNAVAIAAEVFEARDKLRSAGRETAINVLDAENELYSGRIQLTDARGDRHLAVYRILQGIGRLEPKFLALN